MNLDDGKRRPHAVNTSSGSTGRLVLVSVAKMICEVDLYTPISASSNTGISFRSFFGRVTAGLRCRSSFVHAPGLSQRMVRYWSC